jgi:hypothetical protein
MKGGANDGRQPRGGEGLGTAWGIDVTVGRCGATDTSLAVACSGDGVRQGRSCADERAPATVPGGLNLI